MTESKRKTVEINKLLTTNREEILRTASRYGARNVRVFGSTARGETRTESDVDFLVELEPGRSLFDLGGLLMELQELLGREVDVVTERGLRGGMKEKVLAQAVRL